MLWNPDSRYLRGGFWRCAIKHRVYVAANYYERGGWLVTRRRDLAKQRDVVLSKLDDLRQEAEALDPRV